MLAADHARTGALASEDLHGCMQDPALHSMSLLNEIAARFPGAVSFAPGWPPEDAFTVSDIDRYVRRYVGYLTAQRGMSQDKVRRQIFQYGPTSGIICELVARYLATVEGLLILEDIPYGFFTRFGRRMPALKSRDTSGSVIYLGSFARRGVEQRHQPAGVHRPGLPRVPPPEALRRR